MYINKKSKSTYIFSFQYAVIPVWFATVYRLVLKLWGIWLGSIPMDKVLDLRLFVTSQGG